MEFFLTTNNKNSAKKLFSNKTDWVDWNHFAEKENIGESADPTNDDFFDINEIEPELFEEIAKVNPFELLIMNQSI